MADLWSDVSQLQGWVDVWLEVMRQQQNHGILPPTFFIPPVRVDSQAVSWMRLEERTCKHDVVAGRRTLERLLMGHTAAQYVHVGLTSSDVVDTALASRLRMAGGQIGRDTTQLLNSLVILQDDHCDLQCLGRTHGQGAEVMLWAHRVDTWHAAIARALCVLDDAGDGLQGKISGPTDSHSEWVTPEVEWETLRYFGFSPPDPSGQAVARDLFTSYVIALERLGSALASMAVDIRLLSMTGINEVAEGQGPAQIGSSSMSHKTNPIQCEKICGLARVIRGHALAMQETASSMWLERDLTNSAVERIVLPDATSLVHHMVRTAARVIDNLVVYPSKIREHVVLHRGTYEETNRRRVP